MAKRKSITKVSDKHIKLWTVVCLVLVCIAAVALRGIVVYKVYPMNYKEDIIASSSKYSVDKYFVSAVICAESHFNKNAVSSTGAVGLMQIMPDTGEWAAGKMGMKNYTNDMLNEPDVNIAIGCWYLNYLSGLYDGDTRKILAAYNAGPSKVNEWTDNGQINDIPYKSTENYVETVERNYVIYQGLYENF